MAVSAGAVTPAGKLWTELAAKRAQLSGAHQEFDFTRTFTTRGGEQASIRHLSIDFAGGRWRESFASGSGTRIRIFDGSGLFETELGGEEFVHPKPRDKTAKPEPAPYDGADTDWLSAIEIERRDCRIPGRQHNCVILEAPTWKFGRPGFTPAMRVVEGSERIMLDLETGLALSGRRTETIENRVTYRADLTYALRTLNYGISMDSALFRLPSENLRPVKELSLWDAGRIRKQLGGKTAPDFQGTDVTGNPLQLSKFQGKTVLLDFWTTWCPPCRADAPALDKLYQKYGDKDLAVVGVSVDEERATVEHFLKDHPHSFPILLTSENDLPRAYQISVFPTYIVIDREGNIASATEGDQGLAELKKSLKKAGLDVE